MQQQINSISEQATTKVSPQQNDAEKTSQKSPYPTREGKLGPIQAKQRPVNKSEPEPRTIDPLKATPNPALDAYHQSMQANYDDAAPVQRKSSEPEKERHKKPQGSTKFQEIATTMGAQHGVDTSALKATHNSSFPETVNAEATIQGNKIDFAPGKDSEHTMKHEVAHFIDNAKNGVPSGDKMVNGQKVDTTREKVVDQMAEGTLQRKQQENNLTPDTVSNIESKGPIQLLTISIQSIENIRNEGGDEAIEKAHKHVSLFDGGKKRVGDTTRAKLIDESTILATFLGLDKIEQSEDLNIIAHGTEPIHELSLGGLPPEELADYVTWILPPDYNGSIWLNGCYTGVRTSPDMTGSSYIEAFHNALKEKTGIGIRVKGNIGAAATRGYGSEEQTISKSIYGELPRGFKKNFEKDSSNEYVLKRKKGEWKSEYSEAIVKASGEFESAFNDKWSEGTGRADLLGL